MTNSGFRITSPRGWTSLALAGGIAAAGPGWAQMVPLDLTLPASQVVRVQDQSGEAVASEGGEGGEAGAVAGATADVAYLGQLSIVEGHMRAAVKLYEKGMVDEAVGLSYHPEAEMMDQMRADVAAHGVADFSPQMVAVSAAMEAGAPLDQVRARLDDLHAAIAAAAVPEAGALPARFGALVILAKAAADEYAGAIEGGAIADPMGFHEAWGFVSVARDLAADLAASPDAAVAKAAAKVTEALAGADAAWAGDITAKDQVPQDPGILSAVAGRVELAASQVR